jgi:pterin-4a-carbinolamine dehydratase
MVAEERMETTMATTSEAELFRALPGWQRYGNRIEKTFNFDDFSAAASASLWRSLLGTVTP